MAKRFTATEKWDDPWFFELSPLEKLFWIFILDKCDHAGIYRPNKALIRVYLGEMPALEKFNERIVFLTPEKWFIPKFIEFQYGTLNSQNRAHQSVISVLQKEGAYKPLTSPLEGAKDKEKEKDSLEEGGAGEETKNQYPESFERFWSAYPKRRSKGDAFKAWRALKPTSEQVSRILAAIDRAKTSEDWKKDGGQFIPYPATWLRAQGWEDEIKTPGIPEKTPEEANEIAQRLKAKTEELRVAALRDAERRRKSAEVYREAI